MSTTAVQGMPGESAAPQTPAPAPVKSKAEERDYVVLKRTPADSPGGNKRFEEVARVKAANPDQAAVRAGEVPGTSFLNADDITNLVAIPARNFTEVPVGVETTTFGGVTTTKVKITRKKPS